MSRSRRPRGGIVLLLIAVWCVCPALLGCGANGATSRPVASTVRDAAGRVAGRVDVIGSATRRDESIEEAARAVKAWISDVDIAALNRSIRQLAETVEAARSRIEAVPAETGEAIAADLREAKLAESSARLRESAEELTTHVKTLDVPGLNRSIAELESAVAEVRRTVADVDVEALNRTLHDTADAKTRLDRAMDETTALLGELRTAVQALPIDRTAAAADEIRRAAATASGWSDRVRTTFWLANGLLVVLIVAGVVWIRRGLRTQ